MNIVKEARYTKSDVTNNNNKFWYIFLHDDATVLTKWGRIGKREQSKTKSFASQFSAESFFSKKCSEKESYRNGEIPYRKLDVVGEGNEVAVPQTKLEGVAVDQIITDSAETIELIKYLTKVNVHNILSNTTMTYNAVSGLFSTPCGIVTQASIDKANALLDSISVKVGAGDFNFSHLANDYLMLIPQDVGMKLNMNSLFGSDHKLQKQKSILVSLQASLDMMAASQSQVDTDEPVE
jgi:predicted DNA-binding WGR domain protein